MYRGNLGPLCLRIVWGNLVPFCLGRMGPGMGYLMAEIQKVVVIVGRTRLPVVFVGALVAKDPLIFSAAFAPTQHSLR